MYDSWRKPVQTQGLTVHPREREADVGVRRRHAQVAVHVYVGGDVEHVTGHALEDGARVEDEVLEGAYLLLANDVCGQGAGVADSPGVV